MPHLLTNASRGKEVSVSQVICRHSIRPSLDDLPQDRVYDVYENFDFRIVRTSSLPLRDEEIVELPDPRSFRAMNRAGLLLVAAGLQCRSFLADFLAEDPFSVGLYSAIQDGPEDYKTAKQMVNTPPEEFARTYRSLRSSKQFLRQIGNIQPSLLGIFLEIMGPQYVFSHSRWGGLHALEQAEFDLQHSVVRAAIVCSAFSLEDPLISMQFRRSVADTCVLCEGAAALVLLPSDQCTDWRSRIPVDNDRFYGIAHDLVLLCEDDGQSTQDADAVGRDSARGLVLSE